MDADENFSEKNLVDLWIRGAILVEPQVTTFFSRPWLILDRDTGSLLIVRESGPGLGKRGEKALSRLETQLKRPPSLETVDSLFGTVSADFRSKSRETWWSWFFHLTVF